jgi:hypothetical protein
VEKCGYYFAILTKTHLIQPNGVYYAPSTVDPVTKTRVYSTSAYYIPAQNRPNLNVVVSTMVANVVLENHGSELRAMGVKTLSAETVYTVRATKEVIISAG